MIRNLLVLAAFLCSVIGASAQGVTTMTVLDSTGTTKTYRMIQDSSNRLSQTHSICDPTTGALAAANCVTVTSGSASVTVTNVNANGTATAANSSPVVQASDSVDVCYRNPKVNQTVSFQTTTLSQIIAASGSNKIYICSMALVASAATVFSISGGTGSNCASNQLGILGVAGTATHGLSLAANGGLTLGNGTGTVAVTAASSEICLVQTGAGDISGNITYVYAP